MYGYIHSTESFGSVDGPGVRFIIFVTGCPLRCQFCHNPDTWKMTDGEKTEVDALVKKALRCKPYWRNGGGITVSGGEPLLQIDFVTEFFKLAKEKGVHTTLDSSGSAFTREEPFFSKFNELMKYTDLVMLDLKQTDTEKHKELTGRTNENILDMAKYLSDIGKDMWIRRVLVPNLTNDDNELNNLFSFISSLKTVKKVEILPYHTLGIFKWENLGIKYPLEGYKPPTKEEVEKAEKILHIEK